MTLRANSLRSLSLDSLCFLTVLGLFAVTTTAFAQGATPATERVGDVATDRRLTDDHVDSQLNTDDNPPSGDPTESSADKRETIILGMKLVEETEGSIRVTDVTATSPAWDAGIRRGDRLMSIHGIKPRKLARWVEDISKVLDETQDGQAVPTEVERDGDTLALRIRLPESRAAEVRDARQEERAQANMAAGNGSQSQQQQPVQVFAGGTDPGGDYGYWPRIWLGRLGHRRILWRRLDGFDRFDGRRPHGQQRDGTTDGGEYGLGRYSQFHARRPIAGRPNERRASRRRRIPKQRRGRERCRRRPWLAAGKLPRRHRPGQRAHRRNGWKRNRNRCHRRWTVSKRCTKPHRPAVTE